MLRVEPRGHVEHDDAVGGLPGAHRLRREQRRATGRRLRQDGAVQDHPAGFELEVARRDQRGRRPWSRSRARGRRCARSRPASAVARTVGSPPAGIDRSHRRASRPRTPVSRPHRGRGGRRVRRDRGRGRGRGSGGGHGARGVRRRRRDRRARCFPRGLLPPALSEDDERQHGQKRGRREPDFSLHAQEDTCRIFRILPT